MSNQAIDREALRREGWQVIQTEEKKRRFSPKRLDDEFICEGEEDVGWQKFPADAAIDGVFQRSSIYRRRIPAPVEPQWHNPENVPADKVPKGWRFLTVGEANVPRSDEGLRFLAHKGVFEFEPPITCEGADNFLRPNWTYLIPDTSPTPTPAAAPASGWISTKDRLPTEADADECGMVWHCIPDGRPYTCHYKRIDLVTGGHWIPREKQPIPPLPEPVKPTPTKLLVALRSIMEDTELMAEASSEARQIVAGAADALEAERACGKGAV